MQIRRLFFLSFLLLPTSVFASDTYFEVDMLLINTELSADISPVTYKAEPTGLAIKFGKFLNPNFAIEGMLGFNLGDDSFDNTTLSVELDQLFGVYAVGAIPLSQMGNLFGKVGIVSLSYKDSDGDKIDGNGASFGFGVSFDIGPQGAIVAEYVLYPDTEYDPNVFGFNVTNESSSLNLGYQARF